MSRSPPRLCCTNLLLGQPRTKSSEESCTMPCKTISHSFFYLADYGVQDSALGTYINYLPDLTSKSYDTYEDRRSPRVAERSTWKVPQKPNTQLARPLPTPFSTNIERSDHSCITPPPPAVRCTVCGQNNG